MLFEFWQVKNNELGKDEITDGVAWSFATCELGLIHGKPAFDWINPIFVFTKDIDNTCNLMFPGDEWHWYNDYGELHREDGPAVITDGKYSWYWRNVPMSKAEYMAKTRWLPNEFCNGLELTEMILEHG